MLATGDSVPEQFFLKENLNLEVVCLYNFICPGSELREWGNAVPGDAVPLS